VAKCLIIGANGFLGSHLVDELGRRGHEVTAFDRFSTDVPIFENESAVSVVGDFMNRADVAASLTGQDYVFHFLSTTTPASAEDDPTLDVRTNIASSIDLLSLCVEAGISRVYFASTGGAIYGDQPGVTLDESAIPQPVSPYAIGKLAIEGYLRYFERKYGLASVVFRISNPYGPRQHPNKLQGVVPIFLRNMKLGLPVVQFGDGAMVRDYLFVSDAVRMIADVVESSARHRLYNIGSGVGTTVAEILTVAREVSGVDPEVVVAPIPPTFVASSVLDVERYRSEFGDPELLSLRDGIQRTWLAIEGMGGR
jgi:UDP-glucose 4-epimerase